MARQVKGKSARSYVSAKRDAQAQATRWAILEAAKSLFLERGYAATTIQAVADGAGVAVQTVYAGFGNKRELLKQVIDVSVAGDDEPVALDQRDAVKAVAQEEDPSRRAAKAAAIMRGIADRTASVWRMTSQAALADGEVAELFRHAQAERRQGMVPAAHALAGPSGELRVPIEEAAETLAILYSPDVAYLALHELGWSLDRYESWVAGMLENALLPPRTRSGGRAPRR